MADARRSSRRDRFGAGRRVAPGFTLIELLVVVAVVSTLIAILLPALSRARQQSRLSVCLANQRSLGLAIQSYASGSRDAIPRGPDIALPYYPVQKWNQWATNQVWIGEMHQWQGLGPVLTNDLRDLEVLFCPADDTNDPVEELANLEARGAHSAFTSYLYRQLDQTTRDRIDNLGLNDVGLPARALLLDANSLGAEDLHRTNHANRFVNILFLDGHAGTFEQRQDVFAIRTSDYHGFPVSLERRLNEILVAADYAEGADPLEVPPLP